MPIDYSIKAYQTLYRGVQYRSRLEARWAAFFDNLGWHHEYEPIDFGIWSPDFLVRPKNGDYGSVLVEVKPIQECCYDTLTRMVTACSRPGVLSGDDPEYRGAMLTRVAPIPVPDGDSNHYSRRTHIGWYIDPHFEKTLGKPAEPLEVGIGFCPEIDEPKMTADVLLTSQEALFCMMTGSIIMRGHNHDYDLGTKAYAKHTMELWNKACNTVQWHRKAP